jgi:hypothetical protein
MFHEKKYRRIEKRPCECQQKVNNELETIQFELFMTMYKSEFFIRCDLRAFAKVNDYAILLAEYIHNSSKWILKIFIETSSSRAAQDHNLAYYSYKPSTSLKKE